MALIKDDPQLGKDARVSISRSDLGVYTRSADRPDIVELLRTQEESRVQALLPLRHFRMQASPFTFYRGSAIIMAADLGLGRHTGLQAQLCGDAHLSNFGLFGAPDRSIVFDINDFDETHPGPFEWDVKRLATSFILAARDNKLGDEAGRAAVLKVASTYRETMAQMAGMSPLDVWYARMGADEIMSWAAATGSKATTKASAKVIDKARTKTGWSALVKMTEVVDGERQFLNLPPALTRIPLGSHRNNDIQELFEQYLDVLQEDRRMLLMRYVMKDFGHKVVGVGSVGLLSFVALMQGPSTDDLLVLQMKQAQASVLERWTQPSIYVNQGHRVVAGQRLMQGASDSFLGWIAGQRGRHYYVRQLRDMKGSIDPASLDATLLVSYARLCGWTLARAHARAGLPQAITAFLGTSDKFDRSIADFSIAYADQVEHDYAEFMRALSDGRLAPSDPAATTPPDVLEELKPVEQGG